MFCGCGVGLELQWFSGFFFSGDISIEGVLSTRRGFKYFLCLLVGEV